MIAFESCKIRCKSIAKRLIKGCEIRSIKSVLQAPLGPDNQTRCRLSRSTGLQADLKIAHGFEGVQHDAADVCLL